MEIEDGLSGITINVVDETGGGPRIRLPAPARWFIARVGRSEPSVPVILGQDAIWVQPSGDVQAELVAKFDRDTSKLGRTYHVWARKGKDSDAILGKPPKELSWWGFLSVFSRLLWHAPTLIYLQTFTVLFGGDPPKDRTDILAVAHVLRRLIRAASMSDAAMYYVKTKRKELYLLLGQHEKPSDDVRAELTTILKSEDSPRGVFFRGWLRGLDAEVIFAETRAKARSVERLRFAFVNRHKTVRKYNVMFSILLDGDAVDTDSPEGRWAVSSATSLWPLVKSSRLSDAAQSYLRTTIAILSDYSEALEKNYQPSAWRMPKLGFIVGIYLALFIGPLIGAFQKPASTVTIYVGLGLSGLACVSAYVVFLKERGGIRLWAIVLTILAIAVASAGLPSLVFLVVGGSGDATLGTLANIYRSPSGAGEEILFVLIPGLLVAFPSALREIDLNWDKATTTTQAFLPTMLAITAAVLTGSYILVLHFGGGPLRAIGLGPLVAGTIFTVLLLVPLYRSTARACWKRGAANVFDPRHLMKPIRQTTRELSTAWKAFKRMEP